MFWNLYSFPKNAKLRKYAVKTIFVRFELIVEDASHILTKQLELRIEYIYMYTLLHMLYLSHHKYII